MSFPRVRALGALLAAFSTTTTYCESASEPAQTDLRKLIERAKAAEPHVPSQKQVLPHVSSEADHARQILDRYYAISADAISSQKASIPLPEGQKTPHQPEKTKTRRSRRSASEVFTDLDFATLSGPACKKYIIIGGGTAAWSAIDAILEADPDHARQLLLVTEEPHLPYNRTVLSKELWVGPSREAFRDLETTKSAVEYGYKHSKDAKVDVVRGQRVSSLDVFTKAVWLDDGTRLHYDKLLIATGGVPRVPGMVSHFLKNPGINDHVTVFRTLDDFRSLRARLEAGGSVVVIGGGFLGTELALALKEIADKVTLVVAEPGLLYKFLPRYLCEFLARRFLEAGVEVVRSAVVTDAKSDSGSVTLKVNSPDTMAVSASDVVVAVGIEPDVELAQRAGLEVDSINGGIQVNDFMMAEPDVFAAGDVASFHDRSLGRRRVEHWDHAVVTGRIAGQNMTGGRARYGLQSMFWSDLSGIDASFTAVGLVDSGLATVAVWNTKSKAIDGAPSSNQFVSGVVYYVMNDEVVGAVLWNPRRGSGALRRARALISAKTKLSEIDEKTLGNLVNLEVGEHQSIIRTNALRE